jgi:Tat protein secretion system quality control protein TatD with DNase activity
MKYTFFVSFFLEVSVVRKDFLNMNCICESSLYGVCGCKTKYHLPIGLPLYDGHCHVDLFFNYGLNEMDFMKQLSNGRKMVLIDNRHQYYRWVRSDELKMPNTKIYTTYGIHPKYIPSNREYIFEQLRNIFKSEINMKREIVGIGECGLDATSSSSIEMQLMVFRVQLKLAAEFNLPVVLHGRGINLFNVMLEELKLHLNREHKIHWHCINPQSDLKAITNFCAYFDNGCIGLNCSIIPKGDIELENSFHKWLISQENILHRIIIETDFPFLKPTIVENNQYNPISGIVLTAQHIVNVLRKKKMNTTKIIDQSNGNIRQIYNID